MDASQWAAPKGPASAIEASALAAVASALDNAYVVTCYLTRLQAEVLTRLVSPMQLRFEPRSVWQHPIPRVLHNVLERRARRRAGASYLEVGAHPRSINDNPVVAHRCFLPAVGRDRQRWNSAPRRGLSNFIRRGVLRGVTEGDGYCTLGFQSCRYMAEVGLALYALHDMYPEEVACAMYRHGMHTLYAVLHLPVEALLPDGEYSNDYSNVLVRQGQLVVTYVDDTCAGYRHAQSCVQAWLKTTSITGPHPCVLERIAHLGSHYLICITATKPMPMPYRPVPCSDVVYLTDIFGPGTDPGAFSSGAPLSVAVPKTIWRRLMLFGSTLDDDAFCCSRLMTYLRGISHRVTVGNVVANEGWSPAEGTLCVTIVCAYLTLAHARWLRTQAISRGIRRLTVEHAQGFFRRVLEWLTPCCRTIAVGFYRQLKSWISAGLCFDPATLVFDERRPCSCGLTRPAGVEKWVPSPWGPLRYSDTSPRPIAAQVPGDTAVVKSLPQARRAVAEVVYPGLHVTERWARELEEDLWASGLPVLVGSAPLTYTPCQYTEVDAGEDVRLCESARIEPSVRARMTSRGLATLYRLHDGAWELVARGPLCFAYVKGPYTLAVGNYLVPVPCPSMVREYTPGTYLATLPSGTYSWHLRASEQTVPTPEPPTPATISGVQTHSEAPFVVGPTAGAEVLQTLPDGSHILCGDLFSSKCHWLVNAANQDHLPGGGICGVFAKRYPGLFPVTGRRVGHAVYQDEPRPVIHAVAPDYRSRPDPARLERAYQETLERQEPAAYPVLGSGIYQVPFQASVQAWARNHRPGDELYVHPADRHRFQPVDVGDSVLLVTDSMAAAANGAILGEPEPFNRYLHGLRVAPGVLRYRFLAGVPGSGKSTGVENRGQLVVAPTRPLCQQWVSRGFNARTPHVACQYAAGCDLIVDEAPTIPPHLLLLLMQAARSVLLLGDPNQITAIDFEGRGHVAAMDVKLTPTDWRLVTHRCPKDVVAVLSADYPGWSTTSPVIRSLYWGLPAAGQILVFTQAAKHCHPGAMTVHEAQGSTFDQVTVIATVDARGLLASSRAHAIVALTRHTQQCRIIDHGGLLAEIGLTDAMVTLMLANLEPGSPTPVVAPVREPVAVVCETPLLPPAPTDVAAALSAEATEHPVTELGAIIPACPPLEQGLLFYPDRVDGRDELNVVRLSDTVHCRLLAPTDRLSVVSTLVGRYGRMTRTPSEQFDLRAHSKDYIPDLTDVAPTDVEWLELVEAMVSKGQTGELVLELTNDDASCYRITFFQKDCNKFTLDDPLMHGKVGQGISAWPKTLCALFGPWFRAIEKRVVAGLRPGWFYGDLYTEADIHAASIAVPEGTQVFENDFSEFDSTQNNVSLEYECQLLRETRMPEWMVNLYWLQRAWWTLVAPNAGLRGCWKKHSGEPGTLLFNTLWNMTVVNACFSFEGDVMHVYKGDDSVVLCRQFRQKDDAAHLISSCGLKLKQKFGPCGQFSHYLCFPGEGVVRDLFRYWGRLTEKNFSDSERMQDLADAAADFCKEVVTQGKELLTISLNALYYGEPEGFFHVLWGAVQTVAAGEADLTSFRLPVLRL
ncbi:nonstructural protein [Bat hepatitis E virus]|nr:nonstructural protein [Bat hepatitis E virus]